MNTKPASSNNNKSLSCCRCIVGCIKIRRGGNYFRNKFIDTTGCYQQRDERNHVVADIEEENSQASSAGEKTNLSFIAI